MEYLIDTHILLWYLDGNAALSQKIVEKLENAESIVVSIASFWELTIKSSLGKIALNSSLQQIQQRITQDKHFKILAISFSHLNVLAALPNHHGDPFDRILISQALAEDLTIVSIDRHFASYQIKVEAK